jgi:hypothetical protein
MLRALSILWAVIRTRVDGKSPKQEETHNFSMTCVTGEAVRIGEGNMAIYYVLAIMRWLKCSLP